MIECTICMKKIKTGFFVQTVSDPPLKFLCLHCGDING
jgi:hypothetical protein